MHVSILEIFGDCQRAVKNLQLNFRHIRKYFIISNKFDTWNVISDWKHKQHVSELIFKWLNPSINNNFSKRNRTNACLHTCLPANQMWCFYLSVMINKYLWIIRRSVFDLNFRHWTCVLDQNLIYSLPVLSALHASIIFLLFSLVATILCICMFFRNFSDCKIQWIIIELRICVGFSQSFALFLSQKEMTI